MSTEQFTSTGYFASMLGRDVHQVGNSLRPSVFKPWLSNTSRFSKGLEQAWQVQDISPEALLSMDGEDRISLLFWTSFAKMEHVLPSHARAINNGQGIYNPRSGELFCQLTTSPDASELMYKQARRVPLDECDGATIIGGVPDSWSRQYGIAIPMVLYGDKVTFIQDEQLIQKYFPNESQEGKFRQWLESLQQEPQEQFFQVNSVRHNTMLTLVQDRSELQGVSLIDRFYYDIASPTTPTIMQDRASFVVNSSAPKPEKGIDMWIKWLTDRVIFVPESDEERARRTVQNAASAYQDDSLYFSK